MLGNYVSDQARVLSQNMNAAQLDRKLNRLTKEAASGEVADLSSRLQGDTIIINNIENRIALIEQYDRNAEDALFSLKWQQQVVGSANDAASEIANKILTLPQAFDAVATEELAKEAVETFSIIVDQLNRNVTGRYAFSGLDVNERPLVSSEKIIDKMVEISDQSISADEVVQKISNWFDAPQGKAGFEDFAYRGTKDKSINFAIAEGGSVDVVISAMDPEIKRMLKGLAIAALADRIKLDDDNVGAEKLIKSGAREIWDNEVNLIQKISKIGAAQEKVEVGQARNTAALSELRIARNDIRQVDLYETSSAILETESQLRHIYLLVARVSNLSLAEYLR